jgi:hypothetical protein
MTVLPVPSIPLMVQKYTNTTPPAGLQVLAEPHRMLPPAATEGSGLPPSKITPYSGIYNENGKLPSPASNLTFLAWV